MEWQNLALMKIKFTGVVIWDFLVQKQHAAVAEKNVVLIDTK